MNGPALLWRWGLRHHVRHPLRSGLAVLGIALGVALLLGIQSALGSATAAFAAAARTLSGEATHVVRGGPDGVPVAALGLLAQLPGVRGAAPVREGVARHKGDRRHIVRWFGCDPLAEAAVRPFLAAGTAAARGADVPLAALATVPGAFVADAATLRRLGCAVGDPVELWLGGHATSARCVGVLPGSDTALDDVLVVDIATAQEWSRRPSHVGRVDLVLDGGADRDGGTALAAQVEARLTERLGPGLRVEPASGRSAFVELTAAFRTNLQAIGGLALLVGAFLVHAAMRAAVAGRQVEWALLRALGASARRIGAVVLVEALALGLCGSLLGCVLGLGAARVLVDPLVRALNDHYATFSLHGVRTDPWLLLLALALGTGTAVVAAWWPMREAQQAPPRAVFVRGRLPQAVAGLRPWLLLPLIAAGLAALLLAGHRVALAYGGMFLLLLAAAALVPRLAEAMLLGVVRGARRPGWLRSGPWFAYVARSAAMSRHRTGSALAALVLAVATTIGLGMLIASFRGSLQAWIGQALPADVYASVPAGVDERDQQQLDPELAERLRALPQVGATSTYYRLLLDVAQGDGPLQATETAVLELSPRIVAELPLLAGGDAARRAFAVGAGALVTEPLAFQRGLAVGDELRVMLDGGPRTVPVAGIVRDYRSARGELMVARRWYGSAPIGSLALECAPGTDAADLAAYARGAITGADQVVIVAEQRELRARSLELFDRTFAITAALRVLAIAIAVLGIYGAFAALQHERAAEVGLLRALGAGPRQVVLLVLGQTGLLGAAAGLLALPVGYGLGLVLVHVVNRGSFGWTLVEVALPARVAFEGVALAVVAALCAGVEPAWRMVRTAPAAALRED
ncbi:MAG: FtsX-like permease family protein [Planctomycetota bacterium]